MTLQFLVTRITHSLVTFSHLSNQGRKTICAKGDEGGNDETESSGRKGIMIKNEENEEPLNEGI